MRNSVNMENSVNPISVSLQPEEKHRSYEGYVHHVEDTRLQLGFGDGLMRK